MQISLFGRGWTRRRLLAALPLVSAAAIAACTVTENSDGTTTITLSVVKVDAYTKAIVSGLNTILGFSAVSGALGTAVVAGLTTGLALFQTAVSAWDTACGGKETVAWDGTSIKTAFTSVLDDGESLIASAKASWAAVKDSISDTDIASATTTALNGMETALAFLQAMVVTVSVRYVGAKKLMSEAQMFSAVRMTAPAWVK